MFWVCIKAGEFSFGTGLAIIPLLHGDLVGNYHWLNDKQFLDGVTLGQITPGPTTISIVFFGFLVAKLPGLIVSLLGFYIPPLFNALVIIPLFWRKLSGSAYLKVFTMWAFPAVIGGILSATVKIGSSALSSIYDVVMLGLAIWLIRYKILPLWLIIPLYGIAGLVTGYLVSVA
jgi:chromate transporter